MRPFSKDEIEIMASRLTAVLSLLSFAYYNCLSDCSCNSFLFVIFYDHLNETDHFNPSTTKGVIFDPISDQLNNTMEVFIV